MPRGGGGAGRSGGGMSHGSRAGFSSGRSRGYGGAVRSGSSSFGAPRGSGRVRSGGMGAPRPAGYARGPRGWYGWGPAGYGGGGCGCGCLSWMIGMVVLAFLVLVLVPASCGSALFGHSSSSQGQPSAVVSSQGSGSGAGSGAVVIGGSQSAQVRETLPEDECVESSRWVDDQARWLSDEQAVVAGMRRFYALTGVQPYLVIADEVNGSGDYTEAEVESYLRGLYDELYADDGHLILLFCEPYTNEYDPYLLVGADAQRVVDTAGENVIYEAIDRWYTDTSLTDDEYFARIFQASADALMYGTDLSEFD